MGDVVVATEIVIVGGGVMGTSIAYHLVRRGAHVTLVERDTLAAQASGATAGGIRQLGRDPREVPLAIASIARWQTLEAELEADCAYRMGGQLKVAKDEAGAEALRAMAAHHQAEGVDIRFVEGPELHELAPALASGIQWGVTTSDDGQGSGAKTTQAFAAAAQRLGARLITGVEVSAIVHDGERVTGIETSTGPIGCDHLVLAAGAWSAALAAPIGLRLPLQTMALQMLAVGPHPHLLDQTVGAIGRRLSLKQVPGGEFVIGGGWPGDIDASGRMGTTRLASIAGSIEHSSAILPLLAELPLARAWIGLEALTPDEVPILGAAPGLENMTLAVGFCGHGFALSPIIGQLISEQIVDGAPSIPLDAFGLERFAHLGPDPEFPNWQAG